MLDATKDYPAQTDYQPAQFKLRDLLIGVAAISATGASLGYDMGFVRLIVPWVWVSVLIALRQNTVALPIVVSLLIGSCAAIALVFVAPVELGYLFYLPVLLAWNVAGACVIRSGGVLIGLSAFAGAVLYNVSTAFAIYRVVQ